jgi:hypothetical protein
LFGKEIARQLNEMLGERVKATENELEAIGRAYPKFTGAVHQRYLTLVALGLVEAEYRKHLIEATISVDVFEDLDAQRRAIAARFTRRPELEQGLDTAALAGSFPFIVRYPALRNCMKPYFAFPGQQIDIASRGKSSAFFVVFGQVEAQTTKANIVLGPGDFFARKALFGRCRRVTAAVCGEYSNLLEIDWIRLETMIKAYPELKAGFEEKYSLRQAAGASLNRAAAK